MSVQTKQSYGQVYNQETKKKTTGNCEKPIDKALKAKLSAVDRKTQLVSKPSLDSQAKFKALCAETHLMLNEEISSHIYDASTLPAKPNVKKTWTAWQELEAFAKQNPYFHCHPAYKARLPFLAFENPEEKEICRNFSENLDAFETSNKIGCAYGLGEILKDLAENHPGLMPYMPKTDLEGPLTTN